VARLTEQLREAQRQSRVKDESLAALTHELLGSLTAILGWAWVLKEASDPATVRQAAAAIVRNAESQARLVQDLRDVSMIAAGRISLENRDIDLAELVESAAEAVWPAAQAKGVRLKVESGPSPASFWGDPARLNQVVRNLLSNAVRFAPRCGLVEVRLSVTDSGAKITVEDDGPGIPPEFLPHVFEPFRQADPSRAASGDGLGLGLAIARQLVELHGGRVEAENRASASGAVFRVWLPRASAEASEAE
jgi:signal transduction histidine kinase